MGRVTTLLLQAILLLPLFAAVNSETPLAAAQAVPDVDQIVARMREHETNQWKELKHYEAIRHYQVEYKGFRTTLAGKMDVQVDYDEASGKRFRILSQSGSRLLCDKVLKRAVDSEMEASGDRQSTALTTANYRFRLTGTEMLGGRPAYVLQVDPLREGKFLYRGRVWVDAAEYAVKKIEAEPAKNPSFWISSTEIESVNEETQGVWLPEKNRSESRIRVGGTAVLTIDYGTYRVQVSQVQLGNAAQSAADPAIRPAGESGHQALLQRK